MMNKEVAIEVKEHALKSVVELTLALNCCYERCSPDEYKAIKKAIGLSIGRINLDLLDFIYRMYPDLDHLKDYDEAQSGPQPSEPR